MQPSAGVAARPSAWAIPRRPELPAFRNRGFRTGCRKAVAASQSGEADKRQHLFNRIAPMYDNLNDLLSLGQHRIWKRMAVGWSGAKRGDTVLDICCGSGDLSLLLAEKVGPNGKVIGLDFSEEQLAVARQRQNIQENIEWCLGDALDLPFQSNHFEAVTIGYGLRNVVNITQALREVHRVLKPGAAASILDFNNSTNIFTRSTQEWLLDNVVVPVASQFGLREEYAYLKESIARFPAGKELETLGLQTGFSKSVHYEIAGGTMGVLLLVK